MNPLKETEALSIKEKLIDRIQNSSDLPALGSTISKVAQMASMNGKSLEQLSNFILADPSLTLKVLRLANSATYRSVPIEVTNISTAIQLLGLDTIKACAMAMILVEKIPGKRSEAVRKELMLALSASLIGRNLAKKSAYPRAEEVAIAALFKNMGRLILAVYDNELYAETTTLAKQKGYTEAQASLEKLGCTLSWLTEFALRTWHIPEAIIQTLKLLPGGALRSPKNRQEWMQHVSEFSNHAALMAIQSESMNTVSMTDDLLKRFGKSLRMDASQLQTLVEESTVLVQDISGQLMVDWQMNEEKGEQLCVPDNSAAFTYGMPVNPQDDGYWSGKPLNASDLLLTGIQDVSDMLSTNQIDINAVFTLVLEVYYRSLGFEFATICLKDARTDEFRARNALGTHHDWVREKFVFTDSSSDDLFNIALKRNVDLYISDATDTKINHALPDWYKQLLPDTKSFMVLSLVAQQNDPIGLIYADRSKIAHEGVTSHEMKLIKALKAQIILALSRHTDDLE